MCMHYFSFSREARVSLLRFLSLCFFILCRRFLLVLSARMSSHSWFHSAAFTACACSSTSMPSRRSVFSHEIVAPARVIVRARVSWRAASASGSMGCLKAACGCPVISSGRNESHLYCARGNSGTDGSGDWKIDGGSESKRSGRCKEKN